MYHHFMTNDNKEVQKLEPPKFSKTHDRQLAYNALRRQAAMELIAKVGLPEGYLDDNKTPCEHSDDMSF